MTRTSLAWFLGFAVAACNDSAEVLTPDTGTPEAGADVSSDVTTQPDTTANDAPSEATVDAPDDVALTCDAGLEICNSVCTSPSTYQTDNKNCGFCGHDCQGNTCTAGMCAPDTIGSGLPSPGHLTVDGTNVYFTTWGDVYSTTSGEVYQCPVGGCPTKLGPMSSGFDNPNNIAVSSTRVYWANSAGLASATGSVMSCPLTDCGKNNATRVTVAKNLQFVQGLALDATNVYFNVWGASPYLNSYAGSCPLAGCTGTPTKIVTAQYKPLFVELDATTIFMAVMGGGASVPYVQSGPIPGPSTGTRLYTGTVQNQIGGFALFGGQFYSTDTFKGEIDACSETNCVTPLPLTINLSNPGSLVVDAKGMYWIDDAGIETCAITGCTAPTLLATSTIYPQYLTINGSYVYWTEDDYNNALSGRVMRVAR